MQAHAGSRVMKRRGSRSRKFRKAPPRPQPDKRHLSVYGGKPLSGTIQPSGNKNAVLPMLCASLLTREPVTIRNVPDITDVAKLVDYFTRLGSKISWNKQTKIMTLCHDDSIEPIDELPTGMRSSIMLLGPLLYRFGEISVKLSAKGCSLGIREIDPHLIVLKMFGAGVVVGDTLKLSRGDQLKACQYWADYASVTATEHFAMVAATCSESSQIINAACEPHVQDLCLMLEQMGAEVKGCGTSTLSIKRRGELGGCDVTVSADHHEILTFLSLGAITGGEVTVEHDIHQHMPLMTRVLEKFGVKLFDREGATTVMPGAKLRIERPLTSNLIAKVEGAPWPYFPVDLLPPIVAIATVSEGEALFWNKIYEGAMKWTSELQKFGAQITSCDPHRVIVHGGRPLRPATVDAPYIIRVAIALLMVASRIDGESLIRGATTVKRAHPNFVENLTSLGADIAWTE